MKKVVLAFPTIIELIDFELQLESSNYSVDNTTLTITGAFTDREIEMAMNAYFARVVEQAENV